MLKNLQKYKGQISIEHAALIVMILSVLLLSQKYIVNAVNGRLKNVGDSFAQGRQYDPDLTQECEFDFEHTGNWYYLPCYDTHCAQECRSDSGSQPLCIQCIRECSPGGSLMAIYSQALCPSS